MPVSPDCGLEVASPPLPLEALLVGELFAEPESPDVPEVACELPLASPDCAHPLEDGFEVALPELPVAPEFPDWEVPLALPSPEPPLLEPLELPLLLPVLPEEPVGLAVADPVPPEPPVSPELAEPLLLGLDVALPVRPPVEFELALELPVLPEVALPCEPLLALPELPPVAWPLAFPEFPEVEFAEVAPEPPPPYVLPELGALPDDDMVPPEPAPHPPPLPPVHVLPLQLPDDPEPGELVAVPPLPVLALFDGDEVAAFDEPVLPDFDVLVEDAFPEDALPVLLGLDVAEPELPVPPELPDVADPVPEPEPEPPVTIDAGGVVEADAEWDSTAWPARKAHALAAKAMAVLASASRSI